MRIEKNKDQLILHIPANTSVDFIDRLTEYFRIMEIVKKSKAKQKDIDKLASEVNKKWWKQNKSRLLNENSN